MDELRYDSRGVPMEKRVDGWGAHATLYATHNTAIGYVLNALGALPGVVPPYASALMFELHQQASSYRVRVFFHNDSSDPASEPQELSISGARVSWPKAVIWHTSTFDGL